jgi:hypothetical protein
MLVLLVFLYLLGTLALIATIMFAFGGLRGSELRERLLNAASHSVMYEGKPIPSTRTPLLARATIHLLSPRRPPA